jgi:hypothetical protein
LPSCFPVQANSPTASELSSTLLPGRYTNSFPGSGRSITVEPGVYELDGGFSITNNQAVTLDPHAPPGTGGVLFYIPPNNSVSTCPAAVAGNPSVSVQAGATLNLPPLNADQSECYFANPPGGAGCGTAVTQGPGNPFVGGIWLWQDALNQTAASLSGNSTGAASGLAYLPGAPVTLQGTPGEFTGFLYCASLTLAGASAITITNS